VLQQLSGLVGSHEEDDEEPELEEPHVAEAAPLQDVDIPVSQVHTAEPQVPPVQDQV
jgi:hypothetical protein